MGKNQTYYGKSVSTDFPGSAHLMGFLNFPGNQSPRLFPFNGVFLHFPMLWEIDEKIHAFPI